MSQHTYNTTSTYPKRNTKRNLLAAACVIVIGAILAVIALFFMSDSSSASPGVRLVPVDSGISECKQIAKNATSNKNEDTSKAMTKTDLASKTAPFTQSKYSDIRLAGTAMVATLYKIDNQGDDATIDLGTSMVTLTTLEVKYAALQSACAAHGVSLPDLDS